MLQNEYACIFLVSEGSMDEICRISSNLNQCFALLSLLFGLTVLWNGCPLYLRVLLGKLSSDASRDHAPCGCYHVFCLCPLFSSYNVPSYYSVCNHCSVLHHYPASSKYPAYSHNNVSSKCPVSSHYVVSDCSSVLSPV